MSVESNYAIAITMLSDWLKNLGPVFQPMRSKTKTKTNGTLYAQFFPHVQKVSGNCWNSGWCIATFAPVVTGQLLLWQWFFDSHLKTDLLHSHV